MRGKLMKKLGIFLLNNDCLVEDYIQYLLDDITPNLSHLCVIINGNISNIDDVFENYTEDIFINNGFKNIDIWREVIINHIGFNQLVKFDEIILFDDSFFGPIYSFKEIFNNMDSINLDLWTILSNGIDDKFNSFNLQFIVFKNNLIKSDEFKDFWLNIDSNSIKNKNNENFIINYFSQLGFIWKNYLECINNLELTKREPFFSIFDVHNLINYYKLPLINIKPFTLPKKIHLDYHNGLDLSRVMNYLTKKTDYDVSLIYTYLLKFIDPNALVNLLNLKKIIPKENINTNYESDKSIVVIAHIYYEDLLDYDFSYLSNIPDYIDIVITIDEIEKKILIEENYLSKLKNNSKVILVNSRGRDMAGLFVGCKDIIGHYDYFCFIHDKKSSYFNYHLIGSSFRDIIWENVLYSEDYINSIVASFDEIDSLGLIVPPRVYHSTYFTSFYKKYWLANIKEIEKLFAKMNLDVELNLKELPLPIGNCFWAKFDALKPLFDLDWSYEDFHPEPLPIDGTVSHALERIYAHVAASQGFYTEIVMTEDFGSNELTNYPYMFSETLKITQKRFGKFPKFLSFNEFLNNFKKKLDNLDKLDKEIIKKDKKIIKKDKELTEMKNSNSWKLTKPFRMFTFKLNSLKKRLIK